MLSSETLGALGCPILASPSLSERSSSGRKLYHEFTTLVSVPMVAVSTNVVFLLEDIIVDSLFRGVWLRLSG
jgi:hypothetical protein